MFKLQVGAYDAEHDTIEIEGTLYSGEFFRDGFGFNAMIGQILRLDERKDGVVTVTRLIELENKQ